jgi:hypothetical protein
MCPIGFLMLGSTLQDLPSDSPAACRSACRRRRASLRTGSHQRTILANTRPILVGHAVELALPNHLPTTTAKSKPRPRLAQHRLRQLQARGADSGRPRAGMDAAGDHADPGHASHTAACPRRVPGPHSGRTQRTRQRTDTGRPHRTPDSGHLDAQTPVPDTGHRSRGQASVDTGRSHQTRDTGHPTLAEDVDRVTKAGPASGPPGPPRRATARWDAQSCSCGRRRRCSTAHAGSAVRPPSSAR